VTVEELRELLAPWDDTALVFLKTGSPSDGKAEILKVFRDTRTGRNEVTLEFDLWDLGKDGVEKESRKLKDERDYLQRQLRDAQDRIDQLEGWDR
jgi:hypothetical protein